MMGPCSAKTNQGLGKGKGVGFRWRKLPREQLGGYGRFEAVLGKKVQVDKWHHFGQSLVTDCPSSYRFLSL